MVDCQLKTNLPDSENVSFESGSSILQHMADHPKSIIIKVLNDEIYYKNQSPKSLVVTLEIVFSVFVSLHKGLLKNGMKQG